MSDSALLTAQRLGVTLSGRAVLSLRGRLLADPVTIDLAA